MITAYGPEDAKSNYAAFDTICDATQVRQDAIQVRKQTRRHTPPRVMCARQTDVTTASWLCQSWRPSVTVRSAPPPPQKRSRQI